MSFTWPNKGPNALLDYSVDWSRFLGSATLASVSWFIKDTDGVRQEFNPATTVDGLTNVSVGNTSTVATIRLSGGVLNRRYTLTCQITDNSGLISERNMSLAIKER